MNCFEYKSTAGREKVRKDVLKNRQKNVKVIYFTQSKEKPRKSKCTSKWMSFYHDLHSRRHVDVITCITVLIATNTTFPAKLNLHISSSAVLLVGIVISWTITKHFPTGIPRGRVNHVSMTPDQSHKICQEKCWHTKLERHLFTRWLSVFYEFLISSSQTFCTFWEWASIRVLITQRYSTHSLPKHSLHCV